MPESFPVADPLTGALVETPHYSMAEVAAMLHLNVSTVHRLAQRDRWPHLQIGNRAWFSEHDVLTALALMRRNDEAHVPEAEAPATLGLVLPDGAETDAEHESDGADPDSVR